MNSIDTHLIEIEMSITEHEKSINELIDESIRMNKMIEALTKQVKELTEHLKESNVKPLSEETPPPHY